MPFGNSLPFVLAAIAALAAFVADRMAETGREYLRALFPRLALAAKRQDIDTIARVTGNVIDGGTPGTTIAGLGVSMAKKGGVWLVTDAEVQEPVRAGR